LFLANAGISFPIKWNRKNHSATVFAHEISGFATSEARTFPNKALFPGQSDQSASFALQPEYYHEFKSRSSFTFVPFLRVDSGDQERTHFDIRELTYLWLQEDYELRVGVQNFFLERPRYSIW
jgi:hypothetical protein